MQANCNMNQFREIPGIFTVTLSVEINNPKILNAMKKLILLTILMFGLLTKQIAGQSSNGSGGNGYTPGYYLGWSSNHDLPFEINGSTLMTLTTGGQLGIGTPTPGFILDVVATSGTDGI